jgi:hypothetical protein
VTTSRASATGGLISSAFRDVRFGPPVASCG